MSKVFAGMLLQLRQESGISQRDAAVGLGISQSLLSHYEKGSREPRLDFLVRAAAYYHGTTDYLLGVSGERVRGSADEEVLTEKHRVLVDSVRFLFVQLEREEDSGFADAAGRYLSLAIYKVCRYLCSMVPGVSMLFVADLQCFSEYADAAMKREEVVMKRWAYQRKGYAAMLAQVWSEPTAEPVSQAVLNMLRRSEGLMRECMLQI